MTTEEEYSTDPAPISPRPVELFLMVNSLETGGTERQFLALSAAIDTNKFSVKLGCLKRLGSFLPEVDEIMEFAPGGSMYWPKSQSARIKLARYLRTKQIVIAHSFDFYTNLMLIPAARLARVPVVVGSHRQLGDLLTPLQFRAQSSMLRCCDKVICNSYAAADTLRTTGLSRDKLEIIPNGLPEQAFEAVHPALPNETGIRRIGLVSRMNHPGKNHELFLRVAAKLAPCFPSLRFVLAGDGPLRGHLQQVVQSFGINSSVIFLGDRDDIPAVLASLDVSVLTSRSESLSNVVIESMAAALPVVATDVGGNRELIRHGETGLLVPSDDEEALALSLVLLLNDAELRTQMGRRAREWALANYGIRKIRDRYQDTYQSLLIEKGWRPTEERGIHGK
ncbi:MAG TPA: glycosyltransferase [Candidatus Sulfotelmatobacter sp.]